MYAEINENGHCHAQHKIYILNNELRVQGKPALNWVYEVARDCTYIDEVRLVCENVVAIFSIDRDYEPARVTVQQISHSGKAAI